VKTVLEILSEGLADHKAECLLIGGHALPVYGVVRQTVDVDCLIVDADSPVVHDILSKAGYVEKERTDNFVRFSHPSVYLMDVDILLVDESTFSKMMKESVAYRLHAAEIRVPCLVHLIALKLHAIRNNPERELRDLGDIVELLRSNPDKVPSTELKSVCARYGPAEIYSKLEEYL